MHRGRPRRVVPSEVRTYVEALADSGYLVGHTAEGWAPGVARRADGEPRQLTAELRAQRDPRILGQGQVLDACPYADERQRGFYERYLAGEELEAGWVRPGDFETEPVK